MNIFLIAFTLYGIIHLYIFLKIQSVFLLPYGVSLLVGSLFSFMTISPLFIHFYALKAPLAPSRILGYFGYLWMAVIFFFFSISLSIDACNLSVNTTASVLQKDFSSFIFTPFSSFFIPFFLSLVFTAYGYFEARNIRTKRLTVRTSKLPAGTHKLTIAHISDLHLGLLVREHILDKVVKIIENARPDVIVSTGDLIDVDINHIETFAEKLNEVHAPLGKFASIGNHEFFVDIKNAGAFIEKAGFTLLRNRGATLQNLLNIAGIDDRLGRQIEKSRDGIPESEEDILSRLPQDKFTLLLKHRPEIDMNTLGLYDLQLSGHTHKGQMFPANLFIKYFLYPHYSGYTKFYKGSAMYVSSGAGTTCCPVRFFAPPEIAIIELARENKNRI